MEPKKTKVKPVKHGTLTAYSYDKCRCTDCKYAWASYYKEKNSKARIEKDNLLASYSGAHGSSYSYKIGCRCDTCVNSFRAKNRKQMYGLDADAHAAMLAEQNFICAICSRAYENLRVDHDHVTGIVRGLLCNSCNTGLGLLGDTEEALLKAIEYLRKTVAKPMITL